VPEGDTLFRTAAGLRPHLVGRPVQAARGRLPGPKVDRLIGATITGVEAYGKHLLIRFDSGLELRTHLGMNGSWHRYRPGERWRRAPSHAHLVLEVPGSVAVCFEPAAVELFETRVAQAGLHPVLAALGPDILADDFPVAEAVSRLRDPARTELTIAEALLDQRALAGIGNVYKNEALFLERVDPFTSVAEVDDATLTRLVETARTLMRASLGGFSRDTMTPAPVGPRSPRNRLWVYGRAGLPCRRCGTRIEARRHGAFPRRTFWCPSCQPPGARSAEG
jgi:endonuclease-8